MKDFFKFLKEYNIISLAVAFIMGVASNNLVKSIVEDIVMPFINPIFSKVDWQEMILVLGPVQLKIGSFMAELLHFLILALIVFVVIKKIIKDDKIIKRK